MTAAGHVTEVVHAGRRILLIGTAHVSRASVAEVERVIDEVRPDTVCVELDQARYEALIDTSRFSQLDIFKIIREKRVLFLIASVALTAFQRRMGEKLGVKPGAELLAGVRKAEEVGAKLVLADRDVQVTLKRTWANVAPLDKAKLVVGLVMAPLGSHDVSEEQIEELKDRDTISAMLDELATALPGLKEPLIDERDRYLMSSIQEAPGPTIVAVVGAGHVKGMLLHLGANVDRSALATTPPPSLRSKLLPWLIPVVVALALGYAYFWYSPLQGWSLLRAWVLPNVIAAGLFGLLARAHPVSLLATCLVAPLTPLFPLYSAGTVAGLVQALVRPPSLHDRQQLLDDAGSLRRFAANGFARVLLVVVLVAFGSRLGAWVGAVWLLVVA